MNVPAAPNAVQTDPRRKWFVMVAVAAGLFLGTIDGSIVNIALPTLEAQLNTEFAVVQWVVLGYLLTAATLMLTVGRLADMLGKKSLYLAGFAIFTVGSVLCGLADNVWMLILFRVLQAIGAAAITALGTAIVTEAFPPQERGKALGISGAVVSIGLISGPTLGGIILGSLSWHWIFFVNLPVGLAGILLVMRFVPDTRPSGGQRFDFPGAISLFVSMLSFLMSLTLGQDLGFTHPLPLTLMAAFVVFMAIFYRIETHAPQPMIDLSLFRSRLFSVNLVTGFITFISSAGSVLLMPFYLQNVLQFNPSMSGLLLSVMPISMGAIAPLAGGLSDRFGSRRLTVVGLVTLLVGYLAVSTLRVDTSLWEFVVYFLPVGLGMGLFQSPNNSAIMGAAPAHRLGVASSLLALSRSVGQTTGISIVGALWAARVQALTGLGAGADATGAPAAAQVAALNTVVLAIVVLILFALALSVWALRQESAERRAAREPAKSEL